MATSEQPQTALIAQEKKITRFTEEGAHEVGLPSPDAMNYMISVASYLAPSALCTPDMGTSAEQIKANALAKMLTGREMGLEPMEAMRTLHIVKGKIGISYDQMINILLRKKIKIEWLKDDKTGVEVRLTRPDGLMTYTSKFGPEEATDAGLIVLDNYRKRPVVMYRARAIGNGFRIIGGGTCVYNYDEMEDIKDETPDTHQEEPDYKVGIKQPPSEPATATMPSGLNVTGVQMEATPEPAPVVTTPPPPAMESPTPASEPQPAEEEDVIVIPPLSTEKSIPDRVADVRDLIGGSPKSAMGVINGFFRGFLGVTNLPKQLDAYRDAIVALESVAKIDLPNLVLKPAEVGRNAAKGADPIAEAVAAWGWTDESFSPVIRQVMERKDLTLDEFKEWMTAIKLHMLPTIDAFAFLCVAVSSDEAARILKVAKTSSLSLHNVVQAVVDELGGPINEASHDAITSAIAKVEKKVNSAPSQPTEEPEEEQTGLFQAE